MASSSSPFNVAVLSTGFIAGVVARAVLDSDATLFCVASRSEEKASAFVATLGDAASGVLALGSYAAALEHPEVHGVYVPVPTKMREELCMKALAAGKHILADKPFLSGKSLNRIVLQAEKLELAFMDATHFVHHPRTLAVKKFLSEGGIGDLLSMNVTFQFPSMDPKTGEPQDASNVRMNTALEPTGCVGDMSWYCARAAVEFLLGDESFELVESGHSVNTVHPTTKSVVRNAGILHFDDGKTLLFQSGYQAGYASQLLVITGTKGTLKITDFVLDWGTSFAYQNEGYTPKYRVKRLFDVLKAETVEVGDDGAPAQVRMINDWKALAQGDDKRERAFYRRQAIRTTALVDRIWADAQPKKPKQPLKIPDMKNLMMVD